MNDSSDISAIERSQDMPRDICGSLDHVGPDAISGWCMDRNCPEEPLLLELLAHGRVLGYTSCDQPRPGAAGQDGGGQCGFRWQPRRALLQHELDGLEARVFETTFLLPRTSQPAGAPPADSALPERVPVARGSVTLDQVDASGLSGWIGTSSDIGMLVVELLADGLPVAQGTADLPRPDVREAGFSGSVYGFNVPVPDALFDGVPRALRLGVPGVGVTMDAGTMAFHRYANSAYRIHNGIVSGWIDTEVLAPNKAELAIADGGRTFARLPVEPTEQGAPFEFRVELPFKLNDGQAHGVAINLRNTRYRLAAQGGGMTVPWQQPVMGRVELIDKHGLTGWAWDTRHPSAAVDVDLYDGEELLYRVTTALARSDVNKLFGIEGAHGFHLPFPAALYDGQARHFSLRVGDTTLNMKIAHDVPWTLTAADLASIPAQDRYQGFVEQADAGTVMGWAWDRKQPDIPVHVAVYIDGELLDTVRANRFNARLRNENRNGHHVFLLRLPATLMNGTSRTLRVVIVEGAMEIEHAHGQLHFPLVNHFGAPLAPALPVNYRHALPSNLWQAPAMPVPAAAGQVPELSLIVLNWNGAALLRDFLESLLRIDWRHAYEVLVVDHGSSDDSLQVAAAYEDRLPLRLLARGVNHSFSASNNYAASLARGSHLVFANNDLVMLHDCLAAMRARLEDPAVGAVGVKLLEPLWDGRGRWRYVTHHQGVQFKTDRLGTDGPRYYAPMEIGEQPGADLAACYELPASTGALLMCRAADFAAVGGFNEGYVYGMEDVDLCLTLRRQLGKTVLCDTAAVALHNRSATRDSKILAGTQQKMYTAKLHGANRRQYIERHGRGLTRSLLRSLVAGETMWRQSPLRVTFAVTSAAMSTAAGDFFTALELGEAMHRLFGWEVMFASMTTSELPGTDVLVVMRHDYPIEQISGANPGLVTVAWIRNRVDQWVESHRFQAYQLIFGSSRKTLDTVRAATGREGILLPIAANARRFHRQPAAQQHRSDVTFTGNYWGAEREAIGLQDLDAYRFAIYGHGWEKRADWRGHWRGAVPYAALPQIYCSSSLVLDDSHPVTRTWNSLNSRVFDALACGRLVLTNCQDGARELFGDRLPVFSTDAELQALVRYFLDHPDEREALAATLHQEVLAAHTYDHRAATVRAGLAGMLERRLRFAIKIGVPSRAQCEQWGDWHFAQGLRRALQAHGHVVRIDILPEWHSGLTAGDDVVIVLRGLSEYVPQPTALNLAWLISHPDDASIAELQRYHHVFVASEPATGWLQPRLGDRVSTLLQCTDPERFYPERDPDLSVPDTIFVGNSRGVAREVVQFGLEAGLEFAVYGALWEGIVPADRVRATLVPNDCLRRYYSSAKVVLNDHWPDMRDQGFLSNRLFDAGACGATIVTDEMAACRTLFGDAVHYYSSPEDLASTVEALTNRPEGQQPEGMALRDMILARHTFAHRVETILEVVARHMPDRLAQGIRP